MNIFVGFQPVLLATYPGTKALQALSCLLPGMKWSCQPAHHQQLTGVLKLLGLDVWYCLAIVDSF